MFGAAIAVGDFGGDAFADLAIGAPGEQIGHATAAGTVTVFYGSQPGVNGDNGELWFQGQPEVCGISNTGDQFGSALYIANILTNSHKDLVVGVPDESTPSLTEVGAINVLYGSTDPADPGLTTTGNQCFAEPGEFHAAGSFDWFGTAVA